MGNIAYLLNVVYPRACGGTAGGVPSSVNPQGLSPRLRGNQLQSGEAIILHWSIPALAGEPPISITADAQFMVYPRACGGTMSAIQPPSYRTGLSPRLRGNRLRWCFRQCIGDDTDGSIPALAGEPAVCALSDPTAGVYPRACGGTSKQNCYRTGAGGLSPRLRGNPNGLAGWYLGEGSIPALAGEPGRRTETA